MGIQKNFIDNIGQLHSVYPCYEYLTFGPWIYLVPQFKPESVLMLGYFGGTVAGLIKLFYGEETPITGVDIEEVEDLYDCNIIKADAQEYVKDCDFYDVIIVDVWKRGKAVPLEFTYSKEFVDNVKTKCNYLIVHVDDKTDMSAYDGLYLVKTLDLNGSYFYYYMINRVARLPIR